MTPAETILKAAEEDRFLRPEDLGVSHAAMAALEREADIWRIAPGVYLGDGHAQQGYLTPAAAWTFKCPGTVVSLLSSAAIYWLTDAFPRGTWLLYPPDTTRPRSSDPTLAAHATRTAPDLLDPTDPLNDLHPVTIHNHTFHIAGLHRTTVDLWAHSRGTRKPGISYEHAYNALRRLVFGSHSGDEYAFSGPSYDPDLLRNIAERHGMWDRIHDTLLSL